MKLLQLQRTMARAVMQPLTSAERMRGTAPGGEPMRWYAARFIKPNDRLTSFERLEIYNRQYWFRVLSSLIEDFSGLRSVLGDRRFEAMCKAYLVDCPSRSFTLRDLGSRLESWLRKHPVWAGPKQELALDMVRLEWAEIEAFDSKAEPALRAEDLRGAGPKLRLKLQPYIRLLSLQYPVDNLLLDVRKTDDTDFASNAIQERRKRKGVQAVARLRPAPISLVVHRVDYSVYFRRVETEEFKLLSALAQAKSIGQAVEAAFRGSKMLPESRSASVGQSFQNWAQLGWFWGLAPKAKNP
jgi:hypothetical protein